MYGNVFFVTVYGNLFSKAFVIILSWLECMGTAVVNSQLFCCPVLEMAAFCTFLLKRECNTSHNGFSLTIIFLTLDWNNLTLSDADYLGCKS